MANYCKRNVIHGLWFSKIQSCSVSTQGAYRSLKPLNLKITFSRPFKVLQLFSFLENRFLGKCCIDIHYVTCFLWLTSVPLTNTPFLNQYGGAVHMSCVVWLVQNSRSHNDKSQMCINAQWFPLPCLHCLLQALSCHLFHFPTFVCVLLFFFFFFSPDFLTAQLCLEHSSKQFKNRKSLVTLDSQKCIQGSNRQLEAEKTRAGSSLCFFYCFSRSLHTQCKWKRLTTSPSNEV